MKISHDEDPAGYDQPLWEIGLTDPYGRILQLYHTAMSYDHSLQTSLTAVSYSLALQYRIYRALSHLEARYYSPSMSVSRMSTH